MIRRGACCLVILLSFVALVRADDEVILGKKRSQWLELLKSAKETKLRRASLIALEVLGPKSEGVSDGMIEALEKDADAQVRREAAAALGRMGTDAKGAVDALADALKTDKDGSVREASARGLERLASQVETQVFILAAALTDSHAGTRAAAAETMNALGDKARPALPHLVKVLIDRKADRFPRVYAARIIGRFEAEASTTVPALIDVCEDKDAPEKVREAAAEALARLGAAAVTAAEPLAKIVLAPKTDVSVRRGAALALGKVGGPPKILLRVVDTALKDADAGVRYQAIRLAGSMGKSESKVISLLADAAVKDDNVENRLAAIQELEQLGARQAADAIPTLMRLTSDSRSSIREAAQEAVRKIKSSQ